MKLDTTADILAWARGMKYSNLFPDGQQWDTETAAYLASCVRVTAIVERDNDGTDTYAGMILAEAKEQGK